MENIVLNPISKMGGTITLPGSKSISNRVLLLSALSKGTTNLENLLKSDDVDVMLNALKTLGFEFDLDFKAKTISINGQGGIIPVKGGDLFLGNAGTAMRSLTAALSTSRGFYTLDGIERMRQRPIADLIEALKLLKVNISLPNNNGCPPVHINANGLQGGNTKIKGNVSSQFLSALLMASPLAESTVVIEIDGQLVSKPYVQITLNNMEQFGVKVDNDNFKKFTIEPQKYKSISNYFIEGDASSASYFLGAGTILGKQITVEGCGSKSIQGDAQFAKVLEQMGAKIEYGDQFVKTLDCIADLKGIEVDLNAMPDCAMTLATVALFAKGKTTITNVYNLRLKESDRIAAMNTELTKLGAIVEEGEDWISIEPPDKLKNATIDTYNDHRIAMAFSLAALGQATITINDPNCVNKTYPTYFSDFAQLVIQ